MPAGRTPARTGAATPDQPACEIILHASCVAFDAAGTLPRAVVILGASGAGKSALALQLLGLGARLVADDRTLLRREGIHLVAAAPPGLPPLIEARGIGLLGATMCPKAGVVLAVDLDAHERDRLPLRRHLDFCGAATEVVHGTQSAHFPAAIRQYVLHGRHD